MISCEEYFKEKKENVKDTISKSNLKIYLGIIQVGDNPASNRYVKMKVKDCNEVGISATVHKFREDITEKELINQIGRIAELSTGIIAQLPLPAHIRKEKIIKAIPYEKDVDGFRGDSGFIPCTPKGIVDWLKINKITPKQRPPFHTIIIGRSDLVGLPLARELTKLDYTVTVCHSKTACLERYTRNAGLIIVAAGSRNLITEDMILDNKPIVVDVGINIDENGHLHGDCDYENIVEKCEYVTPVPKGVGLLTRSALLENCLKTCY